MKKTLEYWCLSDHLTKLLMAKTLELPKNIQNDKLEKLGEELYEKYSTSENFVHSFEPSEAHLEYGVSSYDINFVVNEETPFKISKA